MNAKKATGVGSERTSLGEGTWGWTAPSSFEFTMTADRVSARVVSGSEQANTACRRLAVHVGRPKLGVEVSRKCPEAVLPLKRRHGRLGYPP